MTAFSVPHMYVNYEIYTDPTFRHFWFTNQVSRYMYSRNMKCFLSPMKLCASTESCPPWSVLRRFPSTSGSQCASCYLAQTAQLSGAGLCNHHRIMLETFSLFWEYISLSIINFWLESLLCVFRSHWCFWSHQKQTIALVNYSKSFKSQVSSSPGPRIK